MANPIITQDSDSPESPRKTLTLLNRRSFLTALLALPLLARFRPSAAVPPPTGWRVPQATHIRQQLGLRSPEEPPALDINPGAAMALAVACCRAKRVEPNPVLYRFFDEWQAIFTGLTDEPDFDPEADDVL